MNEVRGLIYFFRDKFREKVKRDYEITHGRDEKLFKTLLVSHPRERLEQLISVYFEKDSRIYSPPFFKAPINELQQELDHKRPVKKMINPDAERYRA